MKLYKFHFIEKESDVSIISEAKKAILIAKEAFYHHRGILDKYIKKHDEFRTSFSPVKITSNAEIIQIMADAALECDVGPMAAVAGALADLMLKEMMLEELMSVYSDVGDEALFRDAKLQKAWRAKLKKDGAPVVSFPERILITDGDV